MVRLLQDGTCEVLLEQDDEMPRRHISDFRSRDEAQNWIKENAAVWVRKMPHRR